MSKSRGPLYWLTGGVLLFLLGLRFPLLVFTILAIIACTGGRHKYLYIAFHTLPRDLHLIYRAGGALVMGLVYQKMNTNIVRIFQKTAKKHPKKIAFMTHDSRWTFEEIEEYSSKIGTYFKLKHNLCRGQVVALLADGRPEYVCVWLGLAKLGIVTALVNTNQRRAVLQHSLDTVGAVGLICGTELTHAVKELEPENLSKLKIWTIGPGEILPGSLRLEEELDSIEPLALTEDIAATQFTDNVLYIYTSGTTGLPKAAKITNARLTLMGLGCTKSLGINSMDTVYTPLPLYHSAGGILGVCQAIFCGATVFIRPKFSASNFWKDCVKYKCTVAQYIGETCRFLLNCPVTPEETKHCLRVMTGNGLKPQIWTQFVDRFRIPWMAEFYGATEGNANIINLWNKVGSVGYLPWIVRGLYPLQLIKVNELNEPIRGDDGLCIPSALGEPGLLVSKVQTSNVASQFSGYSDKEATKKKILHDVFKRGDRAFNSGDVLITDEFGYFYFRDRTGDTFRWRGENVSTSEVEGIISNILQLKDCIVYGVEIPNVEGKAGMVSIVDEEGSLDMNKLWQGIKDSLSSYARPVFIRILEKAPMTGTFKLQKVDLQKEGFDPNKISDALYFSDSKTGAYVPLTKEIYQQIIDGTIRF